MKKTLLKPLFIMALAVFSAATAMNDGFSDKKVSETVVFKRLTDFSTNYLSSFENKEIKKYTWRDIVIKAHEEGLYDKLEKYEKLINQISRQRTSNNLQKKSEATLGQKLLPVIKAMVMEKENIIYFEPKNLKNSVEEKFKTVTREETVPVVESIIVKQEIKPIVNQKIKSPSASLSLTPDWCKLPKSPENKFFIKNESTSDFDNEKILQNILSKKEELHNYRSKIEDEKNKFDKIYNVIKPKKISSDELLENMHITNKDTQKDTKKVETDIFDDFDPFE